MPQQTDQKNNEPQTSPKAAISKQQSSTRTPHARTVVQRAQTDPGSLTHQDVQVLQRSIGNRATASLLRPMLQAKLQLGPAGDTYEQEADRVADQVVRSMNSEGAKGAEESQESRGTEGETRETSGRVARSISSLQRTPRSAPVRSMPTNFGSGEVLRRRMETLRREMEEDDEMVQGKLIQRDGDMRAGLHGPEGGDVESSVAQQIQRAKGGGKPLGDGIRGKMEQGFSADFSGVRVHTGPKADTLNRSLNAKAFTTGKDIFFGKGQYNPGSTGGQKLLAHELTHTVQQGGAGVQPKRFAGREIGQRQIDTASLSQSKKGLIQRLAYDDAPATWNPTKVSRSGDGVAGVYFVKEGTDMVVLKPMSGREASGTELSNEIMEKAVGLEAPQTVSYKKASGEGQVLSDMLLSRAKTIEEESGRPEGQVKSQVDGSAWFMIMSAVKGKSINRLGDEGAKQFVQDAGAMKGIGKIIAGDAFLGNGDRITQTLNLGNFFYDTEDSVVRTIDNDMDVESSKVVYSKSKKKKVVKGGADSRIFQMDNLMDPKTRDGMLKYYYGAFRKKFVGYGWDEAVDAMDEEFFVTNVGKGIEEGFASMAKAFTDNIDLVRATAIDEKYGKSEKRDITTLKGTAQYLSARVGGDTPEEAQEKLRKYVEYRAERAKTSKGFKWWTKLTSKTGF